MARIVTWSRRATKDLARLDPTAQRRVRAAVSALATEGRGDVKVIKGQSPPERRLRVGTYRVFFELGGEALVILRIAHRREAYR